MTAPRLSLVRAGLVLATLASALPAHAQPFAPPPDGQPQPPPSPQPPVRPGVCVVIDPTRDTLTEAERQATRTIVLQAFETERLAVDTQGLACTETYVLVNVRLGNTINVSITGPRGNRTGRSTSLDDLPNVYSQMVKSLVTGAAMETGGGTTDRTNVTKEQSAPRRVAADSLKYVTLGYGFATAGRLAYGPAFGFGYRKELDRFAIDISAFNVLWANDSESSFAFTGSWLKLMLLRYQDPLKDSSMYFGGGLSWGAAGISDGNGNAYGGSGLQAQLAYGYEAFRSSTIRGFVQADLTLPFYKAELSGSSSATRYIPQLTIQIGFGWGKTTNVVRVINE